MLTQFQSFKVPPMKGRHFFFWLLRRYRRYRIVGLSMQPNLMPGDDVLVETIAKKNQLICVGDIVYLKHPYDLKKLICKRVTRISSQGYFLHGDCPEYSTDSRDFGWVSTSCLVGRVVCLFSSTRF